MDVKVGIIMGSDSDLPVMSKAAEILDELKVAYELTIVSAHRTPDRLCEYDGSDDSSSGHWCAGTDKSSRRCGFAVLHCSDASGNPGSNRGHQRRSERGAAGSKDSGNNRWRTFQTLKRLRRGPESDRFKKSRKIRRR